MIEELKSVDMINKIAKKIQNWRFGNQNDVLRFGNQHSGLAAKEESKGVLMENMISSLEFWSEKSVSDSSDLKFNREPLRKSLYDVLCWPKNQCKICFCFINEIAF